MDILEVVRLFVKDTTGLWRYVNLYPTRGKWVVRIERDQEPLGIFENQRAALDNADGMMKLKEGL